MSLQPTWVRRILIVNRTFFWGSPNHTFWAILLEDKALAPWLEAHLIDFSTADACIFLNASQPSGPTPRACAPIQTNATPREPKPPHPNHQGTGPPKPPDTVSLRWTLRSPSVRRGWEGVGDQGQRARTQRPAGERSQGDSWLKRERHVPRARSRKATERGGAPRCAWDRGGRLPSGEDLVWFRGGKDRVEYWKRLKDSLYVSVFYLCGGPWTPSMCMAVDGRPQHPSPGRTHTHATHVASEVPLWQGWCGLHRPISRRNGSGTAELAELGMVSSWMVRRQRGSTRSWAHIHGAHLAWWGLPVTAFLEHIIHILVTSTFQQVSEMEAFVDFSKSQVVTC